MTAPKPPLGWSRFAILMHALGALLIFALLGLGWAMVHAGFDMARTFDMFQLHKSLGFALLALTALRRAGRARQPAPGAAAAPRWEAALARGVQVALYALTGLAIALGWWVVSSAPLPVPTRFFGLFTIPDLPAARPDLFPAARLAHELAAYAIAALVTIHVLGALKHALWDRDDTLRRMVWPRR